MKKIFKSLLIGLITGICSGMFASGGGLIAIPCLIYFFGLSEKEARANTIFCILPMTITTALIYSTSNFIDIKSGILCGIGGIIGGFIGTKILRKINDKYLIIIFIAFLLYSAILLIIK
jgi:uncharacterized membrane protein YfcA